MLLPGSQRGVLETDASSRAVSIPPFKGVKGGGKLVAFISDDVPLRSVVGDH